ncbi:MAG: hypothetical protein ACLSUW_03235 [Akkermansia sp.]
MSHKQIWENRPIFFAKDGFLKRGFRNVNQVLDGEKRLFMEMFFPVMNETATLFPSSFRDWRRDLAGFYLQEAGSSGRVDEKTLPEETVTAVSALLPS